MKSKLSILGFFLLSIFLLSYFYLALFNSFQPGITLFVPLILLIISPFLNFSIYKAFVKIKIQESSLLKNLLIVIFSCIGGTLTFYLNHNLSLGAVIASSIVGLLGYGVSRLLSKSNFNEIAASIYCASFAGMSASSVMSDSFAVMAIVSFLCGFIFVLTRNVFCGFGGKLGTIACFAVFVVSLTFNLFLS
jgi:hypothetical protein